MLDRPDRGEYEDPAAMRLAPVILFSFPGNKRRLGRRYSLSSLAERSSGTALPRDMARRRRRGACSNRARHRRSLRSQSSQAPHLRIPHPCCNSACSSPTSPNYQAGGGTDGGTQAAAEHRTPPSSDTGQNPTDHRQNTSLQLQGAKGVAQPEHLSVAGSHARLSYGSQATVQSATTIPSLVPDLLV